MPIFFIKLDFLVKDRKMEDQTLYAELACDGDRSAVELGNGPTRVLIADLGGMIPELSYKGVNSHWISHFRNTSAEKYDPQKHGQRYGIGLLYHIAGNFPCIPNFGGDCEVEGVKLPVHGSAANNMWRPCKVGELENAAYAVSFMMDEDLPQLSYKKFDLVLAGQPVHYSVIKVNNQGSSSRKITIGHHNTTGSPFLQAGCLIDLSADRYATPPSEFEKEQLLQIGAEFDHLEHVPTRSGKTVDISVVPGMTGHTDFVTGAIPKTAELGWGSVVNPRTNHLYLTFFKGPAAASDNEIKLGFNDLWLQYGGRPFPPWANRKGGTDLTFCLGQENTTAGFGNGLKWSLENPTVLGSPTTIEIRAGEEKRLYYGTLFTQIDQGNLHRGIETVEQANNGLEIITRAGPTHLISADHSFTNIGQLVEEIDKN